MQERSGRNHRPDSAGRNLRDFWHFPTAQFGYEFCSGCGTLYTSADHRKLTVHHTDEHGIAHRTCRKCRAHDRWLSHFATFPLALPERVIKAFTSEYGECPRCGKPWARVTSHKPMEIARSGRQSAMGESGRYQASGTMVEPPETITTGWWPTCDCPAHEPVPQIVLDPFLGSGTTAVAAGKLLRCWVGIELNPDYAEMARQRIATECGGLF